MPPEQNDDLWTNKLQIIHLDRIEVQEIVSLNLCVVWFTHKLVDHNHILDRGMHAELTFRWSSRTNQRIHLKFIWNSFLISLRNRFWISSDLKVANCSLHQLAIDVLKSILDAGQSRTVTLKGLRNLFHLIATQWVIHYTYYSFGFGWLRLALEFGKLFINWSSTELHMNTKILIFVKS